MKPQAPITRRDFLKRARQAAILTAVGGTVYGVLVEPHELALDRAKVSIAGLPEALEGLKIVQLSDIHLHPYTRIGLVRRAVEKIADLRPDLIVITGDFIYTDVHAIDELAPVLAQMNARLGIHAVLGNHDFWRGPELIGNTLEKVGINVLRNRGIELTLDTGSFFLAGVDSACAAHPLPLEALIGRREGLTTILLAHEPDFADYAAKYPGIHLQLSGHSHGGQIRLPLLGPVVLPDMGKKYIEGLHRVGALQVYTNCGLGMIGMPIRFNCPPQISEITLVRA